MFGLALAQIWCSVGEGYPPLEESRYDWARAESYWKGFGEGWRRRAGSNRCIAVLQTAPLTTWVRRPARILKL